MTRPRARFVAPMLAVAAVAGIAGCASRAAEENLEATSRVAQREAGLPATLNASAADRAAAETRVRALLAEPLMAAGALEIALRHSPRFQRALAESVAAAAATTQSARLPNPLFEYERIGAGGVAEIDRAISVSLLDFVLWPQRRRLASLQQQQHRLRSAGEVIGLVSETRQAWVDAVAAGQSARYAEQVQSAAAAAAELGRRMAEVGNFARIERARQQAFHADATAELARARLEATRARETLVRLLGLGGELATALQLPERLPDLPAAADGESIVAQRAFQERLDVQLARAELDFTARSLGLTRVTSTVNALEFGALRNSPPGEPTEEGYRVEWRLPLFDWGDARRANAEAVYLAALNRTAQVSAEAYSHVRESYQAYRTAYDLARHYRDEIVPLRKSISEENLLRYNAMLVGVFELLADSREQAGAVLAAIDAERRFWLADAALRASIVGRPVPAAGGAVTAETGAATPAGGGNAAH